VRSAAFGLAGLGSLALLVGLFVGVGEARGHAIVHFLTGILCLGLFTALGFAWHPPAGSGGATFRGVVLSVLALATLGSFVESLGGAGYDAANSGRRIAMLTVLHDIATPFAALMLSAIPLGLVTGAGVLIAKLRQRARPARV
jgi:hypothetical protein